MDTLREQNTLLWLHVGVKIPSTLDYYEPPKYVLLYLVILKCT